VRPGAVVLALLLPLACPPGARAAGELRLPPVERVTFENGLRVMVARSDELPLVEISLLVGAGAAQDPAGQEGLASLTADALGRGAGDLDAMALARAVESLGATVDTSAGMDASALQAEFLAEDLVRGLELLRDVVRAPRFAKDEVRRGRDEQLAALVAQREDPSAIATQCFASVLYGEHPYGRNPDGTSEAVGDLGHRDVRRYYERWWRPNNAILTLVGDVDPAQAVGLLRRYFGDWEARPDAVPVRTPPPARGSERRLVLVDKPDATQTQIRFGGVSMARNDPDLLAANVGATILGGGFSSILIDELRVKRSLTYSASSRYAANLVGGDFRVGTFTKTETTVETLALALDVVERFRTAPPDPTALAKVQAYLRGQFPLAVETADALASRLAEVEFYGLPRDHLATFRSRVAAVTVAEAARASAAHMTPADAMTIVVLGRAADVRAPLEERFGAVTVVDPEDCALR
jgi:zinc protease